MSDKAPALSEVTLLNTKQAAKLLGISERTLFTLRKGGEIPYLNVGNSVKYPVADLKRWIDANKQGGAK